MRNRSDIWCSRSLAKGTSVPIPGLKLIAPRPMIGTVAQDAGRCWCSGRCSLRGGAHPAAIPRARRSCTEIFAHGLIRGRTRGLVLEVDVACPPRTWRRWYRRNSHVRRAAPAGLIDDGAVLNPVGLRTRALKSIAFAEEGFQVRMRPETLGARLSFEPLTGSDPQPRTERHALPVRLVNEPGTIIIRDYQLNSGHQLDCP